MRVLWIAASLVLAAIPAIAAPAERHPWTVVRAGGFQVYGDVAASEVVSIAQDVQRMRAAMARVSGMDVTTHKPTYVFIFRSSRSFAPISRALFGPRSNKGGIFVSTPAANYIAIDGSIPGSERTAYHELVHHFANNTWSTLPLWFSEGLAELYANVWMDGRYVLVGRPQPLHVRWMRRSKPIPLRDLLSADPHSRYYTSTLDQRRFYAESWALVHYLMMRNPHQLAHLVDLQRSGQPLDTAFATVFPFSYNELEKRLTDYVRRPILALRLPVEGVAVEPVDAAMPVGREEVEDRIRSMVAAARAGGG